jgi:hypothetical protein
MPATIHHEDIIPHIEVAHIESFEAKAASIHGCIGLLDVLDACYRVSGSDVNLTLKLLGVEIGKATVNPQNPSVKIGGSVSGIGAEATFTLHTSSMSLEICGKVKYLFGSKKGCTTVHL